MQFLFCYSVKFYNVLSNKPSKFAKNQTRNRISLRHDDELVNIKWDK